MKNHVKRCFDFSLALAGLIVSSSLWAIIGFLILLEGGRPIFYIQERVGAYGKIFKTLKFRTMGYKNQNSRLAQLLRKTALDELPQLVNIIKGEMSFVGPRPLIPDEIKTVENASLRFSVLPGLTGVAQVTVSKNASVAEKLKFDIWYIKHRNLALDIIIILQSFWFSVDRKWDKLV